MGKTEIARSALFIAVAAVLPVAALSSRGRTSDDAGYSVVPSWPQLPPGHELGQVSAVAPDGMGEVFIFHRGKNPIMVFGRDGKFRRSFAEGLIAKAHGLRFDAEGNLWTTDVGNHTVRKFTRDGKLLMTLGKEGEAGATEDRFNQPADVGFGPHGEVYVADGYGNSRVAKYDSAGKFIKSWGKKGTGDSEFNVVHAIVVDARGTVYVGDRENDRIQVFDSEGKWLDKWTECGAPFGLFLIRHHHQFLIADGRAHLCRLLDGQGKTLARWGSQGNGPGQFDLPHSISMDSDGAVYVTEITGQRVQKFIRK